MYQIYIFFNADHWEDRNQSSVVKMGKVFLEDQMFEVCNVLTKIYNII